MVKMLKKKSIKTYLDKKKVVINIILYRFIKLGQYIYILEIIRRYTLTMTHQG